MIKKYLALAAVMSLINTGILFAEPKAKAPNTDGSRNATADNQPLNSNGLTDSMSPSKQRISLDLKGIGVADLFKMLSMKIGRNIVLSKGVSGTIDISLNNVTFRDALDVILMIQNLAYEQAGEIMNIMTASEYEARYGKKYDEKRELKTVKLNYAKPSSVISTLGQMKSDIGKIIADEATGIIFMIDIPEKLTLLQETIKAIDQPLETEIIDLNYAKAADIKTQFANALNAGSGELLTDERSARVAISDLPVRAQKIKNLIKVFDTKPLQVFIEAEILQIVLNNQFQRGIDWEKVFSQNSLKDLDILGKFPVSPALSTYQKLTVGKLSRDSYTTAINMLQTYGNTKLLSRPRIAAINNQEAKIMVGAREAYVSQTLSQAQTTTVTSENVQFIDVGVKLLVVPTISREGFVTMKIKPEVSSVRETVVTSVGSRIPIVETSEAETVVTVKDGTMVMIAGLIKEEKREDDLGFPVLSRIPFIGSLFGTRSKQNKQTELIFFLTPHIISGEQDIAIEKYIPAEMVTEDMKEKIFSKRIESVEVESIKDEALLQKDAKGDKEFRPVEDKKIKLNIQDKMKGKKEF